MPGAVRMAKLSEMLLATMGWTNSHLHAFRLGDKRFGMYFDEYPEGEIDEKGVTVLQALREERRFIFEYDFGDGWEHDVVVEELTWSYFGLKFARLHRWRRTPALPKTSVVSPAMQSSSRRLATLSTRSTTAISNGSGGPSTQPSSISASTNAALPADPLTYVFVPTSLGPGRARR